MTIEESKLKGCYIIQPSIFKDNRGYFIESFNQQTFNEKLGLDIQFVQDNESKSSRGVLRGLHYQKGKYSQAKLVRVIKGRVWDVVVDMRRESDTFGKHFSIELTEENKTQLFIPKGFAHGFIVLEDNTIFSYKCDEFYNKASETGIIFNDKYLNINWFLPESDFILSEKDLILPNFKDAETC
ncbi:dTDP-4-dehydrorhamnose 3,5-epimerase [Winogradskyella eckloniae]|uniref:dTDP-4-dehydrorhamnose 3,5-epimerase n=1 Tax=Winogradskyella eckloniae TaxID=1089306 RepID=UPI0015640D0E|nr:dTDP-4-dehydrorhamnose 3,5-epimerase [Winogradskyella eckloniae]NRD18534.1 dTDP-4-dehydrorhamnose 3,5-epimerase [Winogradskyella eckloniae]